MKKITLFAFAALSLTLASCNKEQIQPASENGNTITMTLNASVEQTKATISDEWKFAFTQGDKISLTNNLATVYYPVTCGSDGKFTGTVTAPQSAATWYAYYPSNNVSFDNQTGTQAGAAECYAYSGKQENVAAGSKNLDITLNPQTAILVITSKRASLDIRVQTSDGKWVSGLTAKSGDATFDVTTSDDKVSLLTAKGIGTYYVVVPAGVQIAIFDGDTQIKIKETKDSGLTAGKYYNVTIEAGTIADVLATVDGGFPEDKSGGSKPTIPSNVWANGSVSYAYVYPAANGNDVLIFHNPAEGYWNISANTLVTHGENCYTATKKSGNYTITLTFEMTAGKLNSIVFLSTSENQQNKYGGTYTAPPLPGVFSVSANKNVRFSKGNLIATIDASGVPTAWKFAANQYDYQGTGGANKTIGTKEGDVDLFGWSTNAASNNWGIHTKTSSDDDIASYTSGTFNDWGSQMGDGNTWRTLSKDEWQYLFNTRTVNGGTGEGNSYQGAYINSTGEANSGVYGVILYPDNYTSQTGAASYTSAEWATMEAAGCVFLPAAKGREGSSINSGGQYWSSTTSGNSTAYYVNFGGTYFNPGNSGNRFNGCSVRLITECQ